MFKKFMVLVTLVMVFIFQAQSLVAETGGKEPKVDDFNRQRPVPPPAEQPDLLQEPDEQPQEANEIKIQVTRFNFTGNTALSNEQLTNLTKDFVGKELSYNELRDVLRFISNFYRELGLWARAILPEQDINNGVITIQIVEGRLGKVIIKSDEQDLNLKQDVARKYIENKISRQQILNINQLEKNIQNLNNVPGIQAIASLEAGQEVGETDVVIQLQNRKTLSGTFQGDSYGSRSSGRSRGTALINFDSLLKQGEQFTIQRVQTIGSEYNALAGSFRIGYGGTRGTVKAAKLRYDLGDPFSSSNPTGNSEELSVSIDHPLNSIGRTNLSSNFTFSESDYENKNNTSSNVQKKITRGIAKLNFNRSDQFYKGGVNYGSASITVGDLNDTSTGSTTTNALGSFSKLNANVSRFQRLSDQNVLQVNLSAQYAFKNLDSAEKFSLGGPYGIRAYPNSEGQGDHGLMANIELKHGFSQTLEGMIFYDWGLIQQHQNTYSNWDSGNPSLENIYELQGIGVGANWNVTPTTNINWVFSTTLGSNDGEDASGLDNDGLTKDKRSYLSITSRF
jgi:hemolysin activation/secretion protein